MTAALRVSAGILLFRRRSTGEVLLGHMGGPFWARKDAHAWSIPKGEYLPDEEPLAAARREFREEIGTDVPATEFVDLGAHTQPNGKVVTVWAAEGDLDATVALSNTFEMEWPRGSGRIQEFPEFDRAEWFDLATAREKVVKGQIPFLDRLVAHLASDVANTADTADTTRIRA